MKNAVLVSLVCSAVVGQAQDARAIVERSVSNPNPPIRLESQYIYQEREEKHDLDAQGRVKATHVTVQEVLYLGGKPYRRVIERDGKALSPDEAMREQRKLERAVSEARGLTEVERARREAEVARERLKEQDRRQYVPEAYDLRLLPDTTLNGREVWVVEANPRPHYNGKYSSQLRNVKARIYIDKQDYTWVRLEAEALDNICLNWAFARVSKGSRLVFELARLNDEVWLPKMVQVKAVARVVTKTVRVDEEVTCSNFRKFQADSRVTTAELH